MVQIVHQPDVWEGLGNVIGGVVLPKVYENYNRREAFKQDQYNKAEAAARLAAANQQSFNNQLNRFNSEKDRYANEYKQHADAYNNAQASGDTAASNREYQWLKSTGMKYSPTQDFNSQDAFTNVLNNARSGNISPLNGMRTTLDNYGYSNLPNYVPVTNGDYSSVGNGLKGITDTISGYKDSQKGKTVSGDTFQSFDKFTANNPNVAMFAGQPIMSNAINQPTNQQNGAIIMYVPKNGVNQ